jgi:SpoIID/LytB domain protein
MKALIFALPLTLMAHDCLIELDQSLPCMLEVTGKHTLFYNEGQVRDQSRFSKKANLVEKNFGVIWGDDNNYCQDFQLIPQKGTRVLINGIEYSGSFRFTFGQKIVNKVSIDTVVQSILEKQDVSQYSLETLKALATVLRTDLCYEAKVFSAKDIDYEGVSLLYQKPKIVKAVLESSHLVMTLDQHLFPTTFCKDAGGKNANFAHIFRQDVLAPQGQDLNITASETWQKKISKKDLSEKLKAEDLKKLSFYQDKSSAKIYAVKLEDHKGPRVVLVDRFLELVGLPSNQFELETKQDEFIFKGTGSGLGVGLCLKTAESMAQKGQKVEEILKTCYPGIQLTVLDN